MPSLHLWNARRPHRVSIQTKHGQEIFQLQRFRRFSAARALVVQLPALPKNFPLKRQSFTHIFANDDVKRERKEKLQEYLERCVELSDATPPSELLAFLNLDRKQSNSSPSGSPVGSPPSPPPRKVGAPSPAPAPPPRNSPRKATPSGGVVVGGGGGGGAPSAAPVAAPAFAALVEAMDSPEKAAARLRRPPPPPPPRRERRTRLPPGRSAGSGGCARREPAAVRSRPGG